MNINIYIVSGKGTLARPLSSSTFSEKSNTIKYDNLKEDCLYENNDKILSHMITSKCNFSDNKIINKNGIYIINNIL